MRTQIQLTEEQARSLKRLAAARGRSMAALIREGVDLMLRSDQAEDRRERMSRAHNAFGRFRSGKGDLSRKHDEYFAEAAGRK